MATEPADFRCTGCGTVVAIEVPTDFWVIKLTSQPHPQKPSSPACPGCGRRYWIRCGSVSEFYVYSQRADVCRVGDHIDSRARRYVLKPRTPPPAHRVAADALIVNVCPDHVAHLREHGLLGFYLMDDAGVDG